jgi:hypothetical protein
MSEFEFVFSLFGLMLGFSLAELLSGLVRAVRARRTVRLGWLTPLLALFVMLDLTSFWANAFDNRELIPARYGILVLGLLATGLYYFAASLVFPDASEEASDLDAHFYRHRRTVLILAGLCNGLVLIALALVGAGEATHPVMLAIHGFYYLMILLAAWPRRPWLNAIALALLILLYAWVALMTLTLGAASRPPPVEGSAAARAVHG